jgi:crossover junction endodeoxyribonuclease RuvC
MKIVAVDPGIEKVGYAVLEREVGRKTSLLASAMIKTSKKDPQEVRLKVIFDQFSTVLDLYKPDKLVIEQLFYFKNAKTVITVAQAQGVVMCLGAHFNLPVLQLTPLQIKQALTGYGRADKQSILKMIKFEIGNEIQVADDDESDAIACGLSYFYMNH